MILLTTTSPPSSEHVSKVGRCIVALLLALLLVVLPASDGTTIAKDIEASYNVSQLIEARGFSCEEHEVITSDYFVLSLQRIPPRGSSDAKGVVFLQHGILDASETWVQNDKHQSLAFILADEGYDVWMGNVRGNIYSKKNRKYTVDQSEFWNWSWDEMAFIDLPTMIDYVLSVTKRSSIDAYIGHSQGTTMGFSCFSSKECKAYGKANVFIALAPVAYVTHVNSDFFQILAKFEVDVLIHDLGIGDFLPTNSWLEKLIPDACDKVEIDKTICKGIYCLISGCETIRKNVNMSRLDVYFSHLPAGTSVVNMMHWAQLIRGDAFQRFDYGSAEKNMAHYGRPVPPPYNLGDLNIDVALFHGDVDVLGDPTDTKRLISLLPKERIVFNKELKDYGHLDIVWGLRANDDIYRDVVDVIHKYV